MPKVFPRQKIYDLNFFSLKKNTKKNSLSDFAQYFGTELLKPTFNARSGIYQAVKKSIDKKRNKVFICPFTIFDVVNMIILAGGIPVFIDSEKNSPHISLEEMKNNYTKDIACCIVTHFHSNSPNIEKITEFCLDKEIKLIEDCALSLGSFINKRHVGFHGDYTVYSFGLLKTISTYSLGILRFKEKKNFEDNVYLEKKNILNYLSLIIKAIKFKLFMSPVFFNFLVFKIIKVGEIYNIKILKNLTKNDPNPILRSKIPYEYLTKPNVGLLIDANRQLKKIKDQVTARRNNYKLYQDLLKKNNITNVQYQNADISGDSCINFPILVENKNEFIREIIKRNIDLSPHYYRNCANLKIFQKYGSKKLKNLDDYVKRLVFFPTYEGVSKDYINKIIKILKSLNSEK